MKLKGLCRTDLFRDSVSLLQPSELASVSNSRSQKRPNRFTINGAAVKKAKRGVSE